MREMGRCCQHFRDPESQVDKAMGKVGRIYKSVLKRKHWSTRPDAPSIFGFFPFVTYSSVKPGGTG